MTSRKQRAAIARETLKILERREYVFDSNAISLAASLSAMETGTRLYTPSMISEVVSGLDRPDPGSTSLEVEVINCTTFAASRLLIDRGATNPLCLNFASARSPGGGFINGAQAQEECLARASGLYSSLQKEMGYYKANREYRSSLYTNHLVYSPSVPVFRDDDDQLIPLPYEVSIITSPAVNAGAVRANEARNVDKIPSVMKERIRSVLGIARHHGHRSLVLGAWGCGVFRNDPNLIAQWFAEALESDPKFVNAFDNVIFGVLDYEPGTPTFQAFRRVFCDASLQS